MTPQIITAIAACATLAIYLTVTIVTAVAFIFRKINETKREILEDVKERHKDNTARFKEIESVVFSKAFRHSRNGRAHVNR